MIFSHSRLSRFENCPKAYCFSYLEKPVIEALEGVEAFLGSRVHETLEKLYNDLKFTKLDSLDQLLEFYDENWQKNWNDSIVIVKEGLKQEHYFELGKKCIKEYYVRHKPFDEDKTIACEKQVTFSLDENDQYKMRGFIDRLAEKSPGNYVIHDYKTSSSLPLQDYLDEDRQLALYSIAIKKDFSDCKDVDLCWHYLAFDKDMTSKRTDQQLDNLKRHMIKLIQEVELAEKQNDFPAKESQLCNWCQYSSLCPAKKHQTMVEALPVKEFKKDAGVKMVNSYIQLSGQIAELEVEMDNLKKQVFGYADQFGLQKIIGSEAALKIYKKNFFSFAGINKDNKTKIMQILEREQLLNKFLQLDTRALGTAITSNKIQEEPKKEIQKFGQTKETKILKITKK